MQEGRAGFCPAAFELSRKSLEIFQGENFSSKLSIVKRSAERKRELITNDVDEKLRRAAEV